MLCNSLFAPKCALPGLLTALFGISLLLLAQSGPAFAHQEDRLQGWTTKSEATGLELVEVQVSGPLTVLYFRNTSSKPIAAFTVRHGSVAHTIDYFQSDGYLQPGATYQLKLGSNEASRGERILAIACVVFDDGSAQGRPDDIAFIRGRRLGRLVETERVRALLDAQPDTSPAEVGLEAVKTKVGGLPQSKVEAFSSVDSVRIPGLNIAEIRAANAATTDGFLVGVRNARQDALWKVNQFLRPRTAERGSSRSSAGNPLSALRQQYHAMSIKDQMFLRRSKEVLQ